MREKRREGGEGITEELSKSYNQGLSEVLPELLVTKIFPTAVDLLN